MSGLLTLPKHWRFSLPLLMSGHLAKNTGGHLTKNAAGHLVKCGSCLCSVTAPGPTSCQCQTGDYQPYLTNGDATITITGTMTPFAFACGANPSYTGATGPSVAGTYVVPCHPSAVHCFAHATYTGCHDGPYYWYYVGGVSMFFNNTSYVQVILAMSLFRTTVFTNPYPSIADCSDSLNTSGIDVSVYGITCSFATTVKYARWQYTLGGGCSASCNTSIPDATYECRSGYLAETGTFENYSGSAAYFSGIGRTVSLAAAA